MTKLRQLDQELPPLFWFRGHASRSWDLAPGLLRTGVLERVQQYTVNPGNDPDIEAIGLETAEQSLNEQFRRMATSMLPAGARAVDIYLLAQHHGLPTRLLDWTANPLAALFLAAVECPNDDGKVIAVVVDWRLTFGENHSNPLRVGLTFPPVSERDPLVVSTVEYLFDLSNQVHRPHTPVIVPLRPDLRFGRMLQQDSCFTLHAPGSTAIQTLSSNSRHYFVRSTDKARLVLELDSIGVNWASLFPDLDHVTRQIKIAYRFP